MDEWNIWSVPIIISNVKPIYIDINIETFYQLVCIQFIGKEI